jgi:hypothetical protein
MHKYKKISPEFKYVIVNTGYTSRISKHRKKPNHFMDELIDYVSPICDDDESEENNHDDNESEEDDHKNDDSSNKKSNLELLFVVDKLWGEGLNSEKMSSEGLFIEKQCDETNQLIKMTRDIGLFQDGIACFRCNNKEYFIFLDELIRRSLYCNVFCAVCTDYYVSDDPLEPSLLYVEYDTESG